MEYKILMHQTSDHKHFQHLYVFNFIYYFLTEEGYKEIIIDELYLANFHQPIMKISYCK